MRATLALLFWVCSYAVFAAPLAKKNLLPPPQSVEIIQIAQGYAQIRNSAGFVGWVPLNVLSSDGSQVSIYQKKIASLEQEMQTLRAKLTRTETQFSALTAEHNRQRKWLLPALVGILVAGFLIGVGFFKTRFYKRLNGLRI